MGMVLNRANQVKEGFEILNASYRDMEYYESVDISDLLDDEMELLGISIRNSDWIKGKS
jgi:hypothetical protein